MTDASLVPFRELVGFALGGGWGSDQPSDGSVEVAVIRGTDFKRVTDGAVNDLPVRFESAKRAERRLLRENDIILEVSGGSSSSGQPTGRSLLVTRRMLADIGRPTIPASFCRLVRIDPEVVDSRYAYYALQDMYQSGRVREYEHQSTGISNFQFEYFLDAELVRLPPLREQSRIADFLRALDDKVELNRRMSCTLESIARAIFKSWFVDFDPVRKKMEGQTGGELGLPPSLAALPHTPLHDVAKVTYGAPFKSQLFNSEGIGRPVLRIRDLATHRSGIYTTETMDRETIVEPGDIVVGMDGEFRGHLWHGRPSLLNQRVCLFRPMPGVPRAFILESIKAPLRMLEQSKTGTTVIHLSKSDIDRFLLPPIDPGLLGEFGRLTDPLLDLIVRNATEAACLAEMRDALLPRLIGSRVDCERLLTD